MPTDQSNATFIFIKPSQLQPGKVRAVYIHRDKFSGILSELLIKDGWECLGMFTTLLGAMQEPKGSEVSSREYYGPDQQGTNIPGIWRTLI